MATLANSSGVRSASALRTPLVVVVSAGVEFPPCVNQVEKNFHVQAFIAQAAIETFDVAILDGFPRTKDRTAPAARPASLAPSLRNRSRPDRFEFISLLES
jgi:hypothetical protein